MEDVLKEAGLTRKPAAAQNDPDKFDIKQALNDSGLSLPEMFEQLAMELENSDNATLRQKIRESVLKMHGVLRDNNIAPAAPVTIVINDPGSNFSINPILIPREIQG